MGKIALAILNIHRNKEIVYDFDEEAEEMYEAIVDKYNGQFNLKYSCTYNYYIICYDIK